MERSLESNEAELMQASKQGNAAAFGELIDRYADRVYSFALRLSGDQNIAEDAAQETFIKVWKNRKRYDGRRNFRSWIFAIAHNATLDILRKRRDISFSAASPLGSSGSSGEGDEGFAADIPDDAISIPESFDRGLLAKELEETLRTLTHDQRTVAVLHDIEGMTFEEIGETLDKPMNTVKSHYRRAIMLLRRRFREKGHDVE